MKNFSDTFSHFLGKGFPKFIETIIIFSFQKYFELRIKLMFLYTELCSFLKTFKIWGFSLKIDECFEKKSWIF